MPKRIAVLVLAALGLAAAPEPEGSRWWSHVRELASDAMEGRGTGSPGYRRAADAVEDVLSRSGVAPAGPSGYEQRVPLVSRRLLEDRSRLEIVRGSTEEALAFGDDAVVGMRTDPAPEVAAPIVFVGWGVSAPEQGYDDLKGLDLHGKVAMYLSGSPPGLASELSAHAQSSGVRWKALRSAGAVGQISIANPRRMESPWERHARARSIPSMSLADPELDELAGERLALSVNPARAQKFFQGSPHTFDEIVEDAEQGRPLPRFPLAARIRATLREETSKLDSFNVAGVIRGSDPKLSGEYVVLSAHLDHLGIGPAIAGDSVYNGAMDNASGCAALLDFAETVKETRMPLRRSVLLLFVTGEEKGLLGSRWYALHPTVPRPDIVADVNIDMFLPLFPLRLVTVLGLDESDVGDAVRESARNLGIAVQRDPQPERHVFIRSDQYNFVREGVPSVMVDVAAPPGSPEAAALTRWLAERYHAPSDDTDQPVDLGSAAAYERLMFGVVRAIANGDARPGWKPTSFFRRFAR